MSTQNKFNNNLFFQSCLLIFVCFLTSHFLDFKFSDNILPEKTVASKADTLKTSKNTNLMLISKY
ncbi:MAG: hypothetical protein HON94_05090 [Methylococcales bacterium]|nr:hypothetical protein [Methylococcales bacterium]MBT7408254.1 hypothetical protein [Methylococcales bacterium]